ncbi:hypothetical protein niasHT_037464 [Heterodera trifolii]|uniref:Neurabin-1 n=1 Tax=Heterodera trifolii TaxID=157864 RepID=A0ABD2IU32_9BILA
MICALSELSEEAEKRQQQRRTAPAREEKQQKLASAQRSPPILSSLERSLAMSASVSHYRQAHPPPSPPSSCSPYSSTSPSSLPPDGSDLDEVDEDDHSSPNGTRVPKGLRPLPEMGADARTRFSHTKALFEQLERTSAVASQQRVPPALPSFYSPRLQRSSSTGQTSPGFQKAAPKVPPKAPAENASPKWHRAQVTPSVSAQSFGSNFGATAASSCRPSVSAGDPSSKFSASSLSSAVSPAGSPLTQMARNFSKFASDVERIAHIDSPTNGRQNANAPAGHTVAIYQQQMTATDAAKTTKRFAASPCRADEPKQYKQQQRKRSSSPAAGSQEEEEEDKRRQHINYDAYWRGPSSYYTKRLFGGEKQQKEDEGDEQGQKQQQQQKQTMAARRKNDGGGGSSPKDGSESGDSVPSEPRPSSPPPPPVAQKMTTENSKEQRKECRPPTNNSTPSPVETMRGLSPERDAMMDNGSRKISFSTAPIKVYKTHGVDEYDRRNDDIDPVASCAEYELERRLERMELFEMELEKGAEGLGVSIIGMGVGADAGLEKLGIFVKSITPGGAVHRDGRVHVCDQIVSVDGTSLVGVSQLFAAQTLRSTGARVRFTIGRERNLEESEVAQLIRQSLEQDRLRERQRMALISANNQSQYATTTASPTTDEEEQQHTGEGSANGREIAKRTVPLPTELKRADTLAFVGRQQTEMCKEYDETQSIRSKIRALESDLAESQRKALEMTAELDNMRTHYSQLENRYTQATTIVKSFRERELEMIKREESHMEQMKAKEREYGDLVAQLRGRIDELEHKMDGLAQQRAQMVNGELNELKERLAQCSAGSNGTHSNGMAPLNGQTAGRTDDEQQHVPAPNASTAQNSAPKPAQRRPGAGGGEVVPARVISVKHAGLGSQSVPLSTAPPPPPHNQHFYHYPNAEHFHQHGQTPPQFVIVTDGQSPNSSRHHTQQYHRQQLPYHAPPQAICDEPTVAAGYGNGAAAPLQQQQRGGGGGGRFAAACDSPVPRISEPASPAMPQKFIQQKGHHPHHLHPPPGTGPRGLLFPLKKRFVSSAAEHEFWRENIEAQGLQVLQWNVDDVCQLLIHIGLDKYIPEFTVNQINGPKLLELDGSRLKAMGLFNHADRAVIKKRIKAIKQRIERERKQLEKEAKQRSGGVKIVSVQ